MGVVGGVCTSDVIYWMENGPGPWVADAMAAVNILNKFLVHEI